MCKLKRVANAWTRTHLMNMCLHIWIWMCPWVRARRYDLACKYMLVIIRRVRVRMCSSSQNLNFDYLIRWIHSMSWLLFSSKASHILHAFALNSDCCFSLNELSFNINEKKNGCSFSYVAWIILIGIFLSQNIGWPELYYVDKCVEIRFWIFVGPWWLFVAVAVLRYFSSHLLFWCLILILSQEIVDSHRQS